MFHKPAAAKTAATTQKTAASQQAVEPQTSNLDRSSGMADKAKDVNPFKNVTRTQPSVAPNSNPPSGSNPPNAQPVVPVERLHRRLAMKSDQISPLRSFLVTTALTLPAQIDSVIRAFVDHAARATGNPSHAASNNRGSNRTSNTSRKSSSTAPGSLLSRRPTRKISKRSIGHLRSSLKTAKPRRRSTHQYVYAGKTIL